MGTTDKLLSEEINERMSEWVKFLNDNKRDITNADVQELRVLYKTVDNPIATAHNTRGHMGND